MSADDENINETSDHTRITIYRDVNADESALITLAQQLHVRIANRGEQNNQTSTPSLIFDAEGLTLISGSLRVRGDFTRMIPRIKQQNLHRELLVKAAKTRHTNETPTAIDATAGLGEDALLLAAAGFTVHLFERDPIIAALLHDALRRAEKIDELANIVARMTLTKGDSIEALSQQEDTVDVILLDPMFPTKRKSAQTKKKLKLIQQLEHPCEDESGLLRAAIGARPHKIVIKRPIKGPYLAGVKPSYSLEGKTIRYDCIVVR
ncbi:class I SAM-dependent methyltransferase [Adlercreutzia sp. ZJ141]|uniref:class I SAM-dependent methyltransferase n=1 Tax=Adlercreutzia sp. ZJ141 TaxID=2709406 RepID=UPI0013EAB77F|nr:class I SAM-dependent methyltransferase [Adlercreutzia sp. ZJ141]